MNAINFIKQHGVDKAREVVEGAPDKTATHYVFHKISNYYSVEFQSWHHDDEWWDSDCHTEEDLIDSYGSDFVLSLSDLKRLVESVDLIKKHGGLFSTKCQLDKGGSDYEWYGENGDYGLTDLGDLEQAIADYESVYSNDMGDDTHIENHVGPLCKVGVK